MGSKNLLMKLTTMTNMSYLAHDIQRGKEVVHVIQKTKDEKTYFSLVFVRGFKSISFTNYCHDGNCILPQ
jgi:precorrin-2 methylase